MLVNAKSQVEVRNVTAAQAIGDKWLVTDGLHSGDRVIVSGLQKIRPEMTVKRKSRICRRMRLRVSNRYGDNSYKVKRAYV